MSELKHQEEYDALAQICEEFLNAHAKRDPVAVPFLTGALTAAAAAIWRLEPAGGIIDPAILFEREGERIIRVKDSV